MLILNTLWHPFGVLIWVGSLIPGLHCPSGAYPGLPLFDPSDRSPLITKYLQINKTLLSSIASKLAAVFKKCLT